MNEIAVQDEALLRVLDQAWTDTAMRSGDWLVCKPGCSQCCRGAFAIHTLDALRLRRGFGELRRGDPARAARVAERVATYIAQTSHAFPGDLATGIIGSDEASQMAFEDFANDTLCPVLDPVTQTCDLYSFRPMTCRVFGPPVRSEDGLGVCELCYTGASAEQIAGCEMIVDPDGLEAELLSVLRGEARTTEEEKNDRRADHEAIQETVGGAGDTMQGTIVAFALAEERSWSGDGFVRSLQP